MKSFGVFSVAFLSAAGVVVACANGNNNSYVLPDEGGTTTPAKDGGKKTTSSTSSSTSTSSSSGKTTSSSSGGNAGMCTGSGSVNVAASTTGADPSGCPEAANVSSSDLDNQVGWKCPSAVKGACTSAELTTIQNNFKDTNIKTYFDLANGVSAGCKSCVVTSDTDNAWGPIVGTAADNGETGFINFGACFGYVEGADCGKALQYEQFCYNIACNNCTTTSTERQQCVQKAGTGGCSGFGDATAQACPNIQTTATQCNDISASMAVLCGP